MSETASPVRTRILALDAMRGLAVLLMIEQHLGVWLWRGPPPGEGFADYPALMIFNALGGGAAPMFVTLAGIGTSLMVCKRGERGVPVDLTLARRGIALLGFGLLLNLMTPSWFTWRSWFVLQLMGAGMLMAPVLRRLPARGLLFALVAVYALTPWLQQQLGTPFTLSNPRMAGFLPSRPGADPAVVPWAPLRIALVEGQFPIFAWISFFLAGMWCGRHVHERRLAPMAKLGAAALLLGVAAAGVGAAMHFTLGSILWWTTRVPVPFFPASPALLAMLLGAVLLAISAALAWERKHAMSERTWMVTLGRASLTLLLFHVVAFREWSRPIGAWQGLDASETLGVIAAFTLFAFVTSRLWQRVDYRFGAEWLLRKVAP